MKLMDKEKRIEAMRINHEERMQILADAKDREIRLL